MPREREQTLRLDLTARQIKALGGRTLIAVESTEACNDCGETFTEKEQREFDPNDNDHCPKCGARSCLTTYYGDPSMQIRGGHLTYGDDAFVRVVKRRRRG